MLEIWKNITENTDYQISNMGRIKSIKFNKDLILSPDKAHNGYLVIRLFKNGFKKRFYIHRLVANEFIPKIFNKKQINHIDGNKLNNNVSNLEWCTPKENSIHAYKNGLNKTTKIICVSTNEIFDSIMDASRKYNITRQNIAKCCQNKRKSAGGFTWKYI